MGDQIYPGVYLTRLEPELTVGFIRAKLTQYIEAYGKSSAIEAGGLRVELLCNGQQNNNAVVQGIQLSFNEIRHVFKGRLLGRRPVFITDVDFGVQRSASGLFEDHSDNQFRTQLKEGQGFLQDTMKLLSAEFIETFLGGAKKMEQTIALLEEKRNLNTDLLWRIPGFLKFSVNEKIEEKLTGTVLHFTSALDMMQGLYYLNGDGKFSKRGVRFRTPKPTYTLPGKGLGVDGKLVNVQGYMEKYGYVPFTALMKNMFDHWKIEKTWASKCIFCSRFYKLVGTSPDFYWIAGQCACDPEKATYSWPKEKFFRLTLASLSERRFENFQHGESQRNQPLTLLIKGLTPLYSSVSEFGHSAFAAEKVEAQVQKQALASKFQMGEICSETLVLEKKEIKIKKKKKEVLMEFINMELSTEISNLWRPEGMQSIRKVKLIPKAYIQSKNPTQLEVEANMTNSMEGCLQRISLDGNMSVVELTLWVRPGYLPPPGECFYMIPCPSKGNITALTSAKREWDSFLRSRNQVTPRQVGKMISFSEFSPDYIAVLEADKTACMMTLEADQNWILEMMFSGTLTNIQYGIELDLGNKRFSGVVTDAKRQEGDSPHHVIMTVHFIAGKEDVIPSNAQFDLYMWMGYRDNSKYPPDLKDRLFCIQEEKKRKYRVEDSDPEDSDQDVAPDSDSESDSESDYYQEHPSERSSSSRKAKVAVKELEPVEEEEEVLPNIESKIFKNIKTCPFDYHGADMRDFLLHATIPDVSHVPPPSSVQPEWGRRLNFQKFLNFSQTEAVRGMLKHYIHSTEGPPGCGKSYTCCIGILELHSRNPNGGMIVCVAQTNIAAQVLMETMQKVMNATGYHRLVVRRMMSQMREEPVDDPQQISQFVHSSILAHEKFTSNKEIQSILEEKGKNKRAVLSETKLEYLKAETDWIRTLILDKTDVLICTVGAANDRRLESYCAGNGRSQLEGIFLDEANLVTVGSTLSLLGLNPKKFWMLGDYHQLSACFNSRTALMAGAGISWMQMLTATNYGKRVSPMTKLVEQYRFPEGICQVVSAWCYGKKLHCSGSVLNRPSHPFEPAFYKQFRELLNFDILRVSYDDPNATEERVDGSYYNPKECWIVRQLIEKLIKGKVSQEEITVLSMYQAQVKQLSCLVNSDFPKISICTSDCFEGRQCSVVIVSMVRANPENHIGFLRDINRTNVGISRAVNYLFFVSHEKTFINSKIPDVKRLYDIMDSFNVQVVKM